MAGRTRDSRSRAFGGWRRRDGRLARHRPVPLLGDLEPLRKLRQRTPVREHHVSVSQLPKDSVGGVYSSCHGPVKSARSRVFGLSRALDPSLAVMPVAELGKWAKQVTLSIQPSLQCSESHWYHMNKNSESTISRRKISVLFVDDEPLVLRSLKRAFSMDRRFRVGTAIGGQLGLEFLSENDVDLVVSDVRMPGMDGVEFLREVKSRDPSLLRVALSGYADTSSMIGLASVAHRYLAKPIDQQELGALLASLVQLADGVGSPEALALLESAVPASSQRVLKGVVGLLEEPECDVNELAELVRLDLTLTSRVLQLANSPLFGSVVPIQELPQAITRVGQNILKPVALMMFAKGNSSPNDRSSSQHLEHALQVSELASLISSEPAVKTAGLLHDIGELVIDTLCSDPDTPAETIETDGGRGLRIEHPFANIVLTHAEIGSALLGLWGVSPKVSAIVRHHHAVREAPDFVVDETLAIHIADALLRDSATDHAAHCPLDLDFVESKGLANRLVDFEAEASRILGSQERLEK